jgi:hypothetical protein
VEPHATYGEVTMMGEPGTIGTGKETAGAIDSSAAEAAASEQTVGNEATEEMSARSRWNRRVALIGSLIALIAAAVVLPPLVNIGSYQRRITALMTRSMGRPVRMSNVELRLLPRPGFVLHDLSVSEDPRFGAEPILSARTVVASIRILSLWRGHLEIDRVSVDEASLNLVRSAEGRWNLESLLMEARPAALTGSDSGAAANPASRMPGSSAHFPYLEATDSRVNLKNGLEKSPFSLVGADISLWQDEPGAWRVRLRGQPVRTDIEMSAADTGEVRMEATLHSAAQLRDMPLRLQMEWRDAQLGQLSRLMLGSDEGWRGDVTADIAIQGTAENARTTARLRAAGVRRQEFAPETPLDFDANCNFLYQHAQNAFHDLGCDTAIGNGRLHLKADLPGTGGKPEAMLEVQQVPLQAGLDLLRTIRSGFAPGISVKGVVNGSLTYKEPAAGDQAPKKPQRHAVGSRPALKAIGEDSTGIPANLHGALIVEGAQLKGGELKEPLTLPKITLTPTLFDSAQGPDGGAVALGTRFTVPLGPAAPAPAVASSAAASEPASSNSAALPAAAPTESPAQNPDPSPNPSHGPSHGPSAAQNPAQNASQAQPQALTVRLALGANGYDAVVSGLVGAARIRDLAYAFGAPHPGAADGFTGGTAVIDLAAFGPWIGIASPQPAPQTQPASVAPQRPAGREPLSGSIELRRAQWKAAYLAWPVDLPQSTINISTAGLSFNSTFSYGNPKAVAPDSVRSVGKDAARTPDNPAMEAGHDSSHNVLHGSVVASVPWNCEAGAAGSQSLTPETAETGCQPSISLQFGALDAGAVQFALLGAPAEKSLFSPLIDRMRSPNRPKWPELTVTAHADSLTLGPATFQKAVLQLRFKSNEVVIDDWQADTLGGQAKGTGHFAWTGDRPEYSFDGSFGKFSGAALGSLLNVPWTGGQVSGSGKLTVSGLSAKELSASAAGELHFDWLHGVLTTAPSQGARLPEARVQEARLQETHLQETKFDHWSGTATIQGGKAQIGENELLAGKRTSSLAGVIPFASPVRLTIAPAEASLTHPARPSSTRSSAPAVK